MLIANIFAGIVGIYLYWKRLKEDYSAEKIFDSGLGVLSFTLLVYFGSYHFLNQFWFGLTTLCFLLALFIVSNRVKIKYNEILDASLVLVFPLLSSFFFVDSIRRSSLSSFIAFWILLVLIFFFYFLNTLYRSFSWYKSGKIGFSSLVVFGLLFIFRGLTSIFYKDVASFSGNLEIYISTSFVIIFFLLLFNLARSNE